MGDRKLSDIFWNVRNETDKAVTLYGSKGTPFVFKPGEVYVPPKQVEALNAIRSHKAVLLHGGMGGGKSESAMFCINEFLFDLSTPGHTHGIGNLREDGTFDPPPICNIAHERLYAFIIGQTLVDIRRRNLPTWMDRYSDFGTLNKNNWEFTFFEEYGSHVVMMVGTDDPKKLRGIYGAIAFHDEVTLDANFRAIFDITLKRLRQAGVRHCPWIGCTNTTGPSRGDVKEIFIDPPKEGEPDRRRPMYDEESGRWMPGYIAIHSTIYDNPYIERSVTFEMEKGSPFEVKAHLLGNWDEMEGARYKLVNGVHIVEDYEIPESWPMWLGLDVGWGHPTVLLSLRQNPATGQFVVDTEWSRDHVTAMNAKLDMWDYWQDSGRPIVNAVGGVIDIAAKRGESKMKASGFANSTDYHIFNSNTQHGNRIIPSFRLKPAYKNRVEGWKLLDELFACKWEWRSTNPKEPMTSANRIPFVIEAPKLVIFRSCKYTISSASLLQIDPKKEDDVIKTTGVYGPGRGDDEIETLRYVMMLAARRKIGNVKNDSIEEYSDGSHQLNPRERQRRVPERRGSVWA